MRRIWWTVLAVAVGIALVGGGIALSKAPAGNGRLSVAVHDAPCAACAHVWVTFTAVSVHESNATGNASDGENDSGNESDNGSGHGSGDQGENDSGNESGDDSGNDTGNASGDDSGNESGDQGENDSGDGSDNGTGNASGDDSGNESGDQGENDSGDNSDNGTGNASGDDSGNESGDDTGNTSENDSGNDSGNSTGNSSGDDLGTDGPMVAGTSATSGGNGGWITLNVTPQTIDLAALNGSAFAQTIGILSLPAGHYDQIRLAISNVVVQLVNGTNVTAKLSGNGFAVAHGSFVLSAGGTTSVSIDIDLASSVHIEGNGAVMFTPNIGAVTVS